MIDLSSGEPTFLQEHLDRFYPHAFGFAQYRTQKGVSYPPVGGDESLRDALRAYHLRVHGKHYDHVVITTGGKQALLAAVQAQVTLIRPVPGALHHPVPYWPSYPSIADLSGLFFNTHSLNPDGVIRVATAPNNPNGSEFIEGRPHVLDAAYCHPLYGAKAPTIAGCTTWSGSKLFGLSGIRIGWLTTNDKDLAARAADYVEATTSGVSRASQAVLSAMVTMSSSPDFEKAMKSARKSLLGNADLFCKKLEDFLDELQGLPANYKGGFAWFKPQDYQKFEHALGKAEVHLTQGEDCGGDEGWYRMNLGASSLQLDFGLSKIRKAMK